MSTAGLVLVGVRKSFGTQVAVDDVTVDFASGSLTALLGPSGCGKSTTLSMVAGLLEPDAGQITVGGRSVLQQPAQRRPVGLVFQRPLLFPHLDVARNVGFGLRMRGIDRREIRRQVGQALEQVHLSDLARRRVGELSGGQEQRVALARALILRPQVLLLDEPFSQLDPVLRGQMRELVTELHTQTGVTTVFVTHDQTEAVQMADRIALMLSGRVAGHGEPSMFYTDPPSLAAARFFAVTNEFPGEAASGVFRAAGAPLVRATDLPDGQAVLVVRPERILLTDDQMPSSVSATRGHNLSGVAIEAKFAGTHLAVQVHLPGHLQVEVHAPVGTAVSLGSTVQICIPGDAGTVVPAEQQTATAEQQK